MDRRHLLQGALSGVLSGALTGFTPLAAQGARAATGYLRTNWSRDPYSYGSYSYFAKGSRRRQTRDLAAPVAGRLFFAGEATHPEYNSTVHAAYESGLIAAEAMAETDAQTIAVIGAGVSGLAAAQALAGQGRAVTVLEARSRIGGRIWTDTRLGLPLDLGASWIHGDQGNPMVRRARDQGIKTRVTSDSYVIRGGDGRRMRDRDAPGWLDQVTEVQHSAGADLGDLNLRAYANDQDYDGRDLLMPRGYGQILRPLADGLAIRLNTPVRQVEVRADGVRLNGAQRFDAVLVTVPLGVLKMGSIRFDPPLPPAKQAAIAALGMGLLDKLYLRYDAVFWDREVTWILTPETGQPPGVFNQWLNLYPYTGQPVIMAFNAAGPARAMAAQSDAQLVTLAQSVLARAYP